MGSETWHEPYELLSPETRDMHRAIASLIEELEAIDWYQQRVEVTSDAELAATLRHHRDEEIEHAMMNLEWIRRRSAAFDARARTYLFSEGPITAVEETATHGAAAPAADAGPGDTSLGIGSLKPA